jgi:hypothetical protein
VRELRLLVAAGALVFLAGGLVGWFTAAGPASGWEDRAVRPHELVGVGGWAWLAALPMLLAPLAPFTRRWLAALWPAAVLPLAATAAAGVGGAGGAPRLPGLVVLPDPRVGLALSLVGAAVAVMGLVAAWRRAVGDGAARVAWAPRHASGD